MSAALFDLALRVSARDRGGVVPRLLHNPAPKREVTVAVSAKRAGRVVRVHAIGPGGRVESGSGAAGLAAIAHAAGCADGDLGGGPGAVVEGGASLRALAVLATRFADPVRCDSVAVAAGSALAGWWVERAAHPGTTAVADVLAVSRQRYVLGVAPGADHPNLWRRAFGAAGGLAGVRAWHRDVTAGPVLPGLEPTREDDDWLLGTYQGALNDGRSWDVPESLYLAAARLRSRCDAADVFEAALLCDPLWRARGVHTGHVCTGEVVVGASSAGTGRVVLHANRLDTRLRAGTAVIGWAGAPMADMPDVDARFSGEVVTTSVEDGALAVTIAGLRRSGYRPAAGEIVTLIPAPPSPSTIRSGRRVLARLYRRRFSWLSQGVTPAPVRRDVPLAVVIAAAENDEHDNEGDL
ncbi:hypothetical protein E3G68_005339 [Mycobacteroides abscessus]|uniref:hypothetical protein n=1 Tax=Mycobacteroides abscessus TaxID=36809 RepID=UPI001877BA23|nr:hypothetical protein [Mycobacteroides abscessus]